MSTYVPPRRPQLALAAPTLVLLPRVRRGRSFWLRRSALGFARRAGSSDTIAGTYLDLLKIKGDTPEERLQNGVDALRESVTASASMKSGVVTLRTTAPWPGLATA